MAETLQERKPSYAVVRRIVRNLPAGMLMLAHQGNQAYSEGFDLVHRREALKRNSIWQVDHAQLDIKLLRDDGSIGKPWLTLSSMTTVVRWRATISALSPLLPSERHLPYARAFGGRVIPTSKSAVFQTFCTPTTDRIFDQNILSRSLRI